MANTKPKQSTRQRSWKKYMLIGLVVLVIVVPLGLWGYQKYLDKVDADRFAALQSDFKKLQTEFNKIDPDWEYEEGCTETGAPFGRGTISCQVSLTNTADVFKNSALYEYSLKSVLEINNEEQRSGKSDEGNDFAGLGFDAKGHLGLGRCVLRVEKATESHVLCNYEARKAYYPMSE